MQWVCSGVENSALWKQSATRFCVWVIAGVEPSCPFRLVIWLCCLCTPSTLFGYLALLFVYTLYIVWLFWLCCLYRLFWLCCLYRLFWLCCLCTPCALFGYFGFAVCTPCYLLFWTTYIAACKCIGVQSYQYMSVNDLVLYAQSTVLVISWQTSVRDASLFTD